MSIWPPVCHPEDQHLQLVLMNNSNVSLAHQSSSFHMVEATSDNLGIPTLVPPVPPELPNSDDIILYKYLVLKVFFLIWDVVGAFLNGLGIDLLWHRVEINHAVYSIVLHDIILALVSSVVTLVINTFFWSDDLAWFRIHALLNLLPFVFHNWAWAIISNLRCVNITQSDDWFELDQDVTRRYSLCSTWAIALINYLPLVPYILVTLDPYRNSKIEVLWAVLFYSGLVISFVLAAYHYVRIYLFARCSTEQSQSEPPFGANASSRSANIQSPSPLPNLTVTQSGNQSTVFPDFSEDEDLLDTPESPSIKQAAAVFSALRTMILVTLIPVGILVIQMYYLDSLWANALVAFLLAFFKSPGILCISIFNFGPIRNQVGVYMEDFPDHFRDTVQPLFDWVDNFCAWRTAATESDERNIVEAGDDLERAISPPIRSKSRLNIVGKRDSAVSPTNSEMLPEVQC